MHKQRGEFADLVAQYNAARPSYPTKVITAICESIGQKEPLILDVGCGTGISTRQLAEKGGVVIGCDIDINMLTAALRHRHTNVAYVQGQAKTLPFRSGIFDAVTAFTAFHWFTDKRSLKEFKRVLKPTGLFCIVHPRNTSPYGKDLRAMIEKRIGHKTKNNYSDEAFDEVLTQAGFTCSHLPIVKQSTAYSLKTFLLLLQSYSVWNNVPQKLRPGLLRQLKNHYQPKLNNGYMIDTRDIEITVARKK